jgi:hypothetical protein
MSSSSVDSIVPGCPKAFINDKRMTVHVRVYHKLSVKVIRKKRPAHSSRIRSANYREREAQKKRVEHIKSLGYSGMLIVF